MVPRNATREQGNAPCSLLCVVTPFARRVDQEKGARDFDKIDKNRNGWLDKGELHDGYMGMGPLAGKKSHDEVAA